MGKELCGRIRALRYFKWVRDFQIKNISIVCPKSISNTFCHCCENNGNVERKYAGVLSSCGHVGCLNCLRFHADREECVEKSCQSPVKYTNVVSAVDLGFDN